MVGGVGGGPPVMPRSGSPTPRQGPPRLFGVWPILLTPFDEHDRIDEDGLREQVRFCVAAGAQGVAGPAIFSEFHMLADSERKRFVEVVSAAAADARIPFIAACSGVSASHAIELCRHAESAGATALMLMPPYTAQHSADVVAEYYRRVSREVEVPIILQNPPPGTGTSLSVSSIIQLASELPNLRYVKEECPPVHHRVSHLLEGAQGALWGVFTGLGGLYMLTELRRGAAGVMPAAEFVDVHCRIYDAFVSGREQEAQDLYGRLLPAIVLEGLLGPQFAKEVLRRRGVLETARTRIAHARMDRQDMAELDRLWPELDALFA